MDKEKRTTPLNRFIQRFYKRTFGSFGDWNSARELNQEVTTRMKKSDDGRREYWSCRGCSRALVSDMNGYDVEIFSSSGNKLLLNFNHMVAYCGNNNCPARWNIMSFDYEDDVVGDTVAGLLDKVPNGVDQYNFIKNKWLELDK